MSRACTPCWKHCTAHHSVKEPLSKYFRMLGDRLNYIHICNNDGVTDAHLRLEAARSRFPDALDVFKQIMAGKAM